MTQLELLNPSREMIGRLNSLESAVNFMFAGNAVFTIRSTKTGTHFTFKVRKSKPEPGKHFVYFVSLLNGPDNNNDFAYMGIFEGKLKGIGPLHTLVFKHTRASRVTSEAKSFQAFAWLWRQMAEHRCLPTNVEIWHEGRCGRCGRKLTVPESITAGLGPECAERGL